MSRPRRHLVAALAMCLGSSAVLGLVWAMNALGSALPPAVRQASTAFQVEPEKPKAEPKRKPKPKKQKPQPQAAARAPAPNLAAGLSGLNFELPSFELDAMGAAADELLGETQQEQVMTADAVDDKPVPRRQTAPAFPERARRRGVEGFVRLSMLIDTAGRVSTVRVLESEPHGVFDEAALSAVKQWAYRPAVYHGNPVKIWVEQQLQFRLN